MSTEEKIGTNGKPFGVGYKGKGMCKACVYSKPKQFYAGAPLTLLCTWFSNECKSVSRNCSGIRNLKEEYLNSIKQGV